MIIPNCPFHLLLLLQKLWNPSAYNAYILVIISISDKKWIRNECIACILAHFLCTSLLLQASTDIWKFNSTLRCGYNRICLPGLALLITQASNLIKLFWAWCTKIRINLLKISNSVLAIWRESTDHCIWNVLPILDINCTSVMRGIALRKLMLIVIR